MALRDSEPIYFYELHESDEDLFTDVLLAHDAEYDEEEFLAMVLEARQAVLAKFEQDSLAEAIAQEMQRRFGFLVVDDSQLRAAVNVSAEEDETRVVPVEERQAGPAPGEADDFRSMLIEVETEDRAWRD